MKIKKTKINTKPLDQLLKDVKWAFKELAKDLDLEFEAVIQDTGAFADVGLAGRDIVLSGALRDSQKMKIASEGGNIKYTWEWDPVAPDTGYHYAYDVFVGFTSQAGNFIPGRNWPGKAVDRLEPALYLKRKLKEKK